MNEVHWQGIDLAFPAIASVVIGFDTAVDSARKARSGALVSVARSIGSVVPSVRSMRP